MIYLDSCALVKLILTEPFSNRLVEYISENGHVEHVSSELAVTEVRRALRRNNLAVPGGRGEAVLDRNLARADELFDSSISVLEITKPILDMAGDFVEPTLRSLDAVHLATAATIASALTAFITYDDRLEKIAQVVGLPAVRPT